MRATGFPHGQADGEAASLALQHYMSAKGVELGRERAKAAECLRRLQRAGRRWEEADVERRELSARLRAERSASRRQIEQLLRMVSERDERLASLQQQLVDVVRAEIVDESAVGGAQAGGAARVGGEDGAKYMRARKLKAAQVLRDHMVQMQLQDRARAHELTRIRADGESALALTMSTHRSAETDALDALRNQVAELESQGGVQAIIEANELIDHLQEELAFLQQKNGDLEDKLSAATTAITAT